MTVTHRLRAALVPFASVVAGLVLAACGGEVPAPPVSLSPVAEAGRQLAINNGCTACHGTDFGGGVGPSFKGLAGSTVTLSDGSTAFADTAYLTRAIMQPDAQITKGYTIKMPANALSADQVAQVVAFIEALGTKPTSTSPSSTRPSGG